jgi:hypothetical protein
MPDFHWRVIYRPRQWDTIGIWHRRSTFKFRRVSFHRYFNRLNSVHIPSACHRAWRDWEIAIPPCYVQLRCQILRGMAAFLSLQDADLKHSIT